MLRVIYALASVGSHYAWKDYHPPFHPFGGCWRDIP